MTRLPLIFVPGAGSDPRAWAEQIALLPDWDCRAVDCTAFDSIAAMAEHVLAQVQGRFILCGTSMGGYVALAAVCRAPERIAQLVLANTNARADTPERHQARLQEIAQGPAAFIAQRQPGAYPSYVAGFLAARSMQNAALVERLRVIALTVGYEAYVRHQQACMNRTATLAQLPQLTMPVLLLGGEEDRVTPPEQQHEIAARVPQAALHILPRCGHNAQQEQPQLFHNALKDFLARYHD